MILQSCVMLICYFFVLLFGFGLIVNILELLFNFVFVQYILVIFFLITIPGSEKVTFNLVNY